MVEISAGLQHGYKFHALRLRGVLLLSINAAVQADFGFQIRGPLVAIKLPQYNKIQKPKAMKAIPPFISSEPQNIMQVSSVSNRCFDND